MTDSDAPVLSDLSGIDDEYIEDIKKRINSSKEDPSEVKSIDKSVKKRLFMGAEEASEIRKGILQLVPSEIIMFSTGKQLEQMVNNGLLFSFNSFRKF